jgi:tRNA(Ile)-lysidine synthase
MALLSMCLESGRPVAVAHVNYHHRPEAEEEEAYLRAFCSQHQLKLYVRNEPFAYQGNFEAAARKWRYDFFEQTVKQQGYAGILIGHQEDDVIETYLMQEERHIIPDTYGLKKETMYHGVRVERPLLGYTKQQLKEYCDQRHIKYYIDATNASDDITRNRIRHEMVEPMTCFERDLLLKEIASLNAIAQERRCRVKTEIHDSKVSLERYRSLDEADRLVLLRMVVEPQKRDQTGISQAQLGELDHVIMSRRDFMMDVHGRTLVQDQGMFFLHTPYEPYELVFNTLEALRQQADTRCFSIRPGSPGVQAVTLSEADFPLTIRNVHPGDRISMRFGSKSIHRFFVDRQIPLYQRPCWPVVVNASQEVILVPGIGCDQRHFSMMPDINVLQYASD